MGDELDRAAARLAAARIPEPRREAAAIWAGLAGMLPGEVWRRREAAVVPPLRGRFRSAVERRRRGEPLAYVTGLAGFRTLDLVVDARVLIPRPETEGLGECVLRWARSRRATTDRWGRAADIGTGSGCIALSLALEGQFDRVVATDVSAAALRVAQENLRRIAPPVPVELRLGSLFAPLAGERFDVLVANPPYLSEAEFAALDDGVRRYEPRRALVAGADGLWHTRALLAGAGDHLVPGGLLALEVDCRRAAAALRLARAAGLCTPHIQPDLFGLPRYLLATRGTTS